eukprot:s3962_g1.t1
MHPICEHPSDLTIQSPGPEVVKCSLWLQLVQKEEVRRWSPTRPNRKSSSAHCGCSWSKKRRFVAGPYPSRQEVVKCSLWLQLVQEEEIRRWLGAYFTTIPVRKEAVQCSVWAEEEIRRWLGAYFTTIPVRKEAVQCSVWAQLLQEDDVGRWSGADFTAPTRPKREAVKCSLGLQLVQEIPTSGVSHELLDRIAAVVVETGPGLAIVPQLLATATPRAAPTRGSRFAGPVCISPPYPSEQEVVKCSLWLQLVHEEEVLRWSPTRPNRKSSSAHCGCSWSKKRRFAAGWERTSPPYPSERRPSSAHYGRSCSKKTMLGVQRASKVDG